MFTLKELAASVSEVVNEPYGRYDLGYSLEKVIDGMVAAKYDAAQRQSAKAWFMANSGDTQAKLFAVQADYSAICYILDNYSSVMEAAELAAEKYDTIEVITDIAKAIQGGWRVLLVHLYADLFSNMNELCLEVPDDIVALGGRIKAL